MSETTTSYIGFGCDFQRSTDGGTTYTSIAELTDVTAPGGETADIDKSSLQVVNAFRQMRPGLRKHKPPKFTFLFSAATLANIISDWQNRTVQYWRFAFSDTGNSHSSQFYGPAYVQSYEIKSPLEGNIEVEVTLTPSGEWTWSAAA